MARAGYVPARGDFVRVVLDPLVGRERSGERPALVLSEREFNALTGSIFCAPVTGTRRGWPFEVPVPASGKVEGVVLSDQTTSIALIAGLVARSADLEAEKQRRIISHRCTQMHADGEPSPAPETGN